jgi:uncharacterized phage-associated protein
MSIASPRIDKEKLLQALLYIAEKSPNRDIYHMVKILYFAEKWHLEQYGRLICGSIYAKMPLGPVPSEAYDLLKALTGNKSYFVMANMTLLETLQACLSVRTDVKYPWYDAKRPPDLEVFSRSDLNCLDKAIREIGSLDFEELRDRSHDDVWKAAKQANEHYISVETFVSGLTNKEALLEFISDRG